MLTFREYLLKLEEELHRVDPRPIDDFSENQREYAVSPDGSGSGAIGSGWTPPINYRISRGTFAATPKHAAPYAAPRNVKWTHHTDPDTGKSILTFDKRDEQSIRNYRPVLSTWSDRRASQARFARPGSVGKRYGPGKEGEFMSPNPGRPTSQRVIQDPIKHMKDAGYEVRFSDDIDKHRQ